MAALFFAMPATIQNCNHPQIYMIRFCDNL